MNKILIPALLVATVMVAGMFAFAPVEQASTVHTTGTSQGTASVSTDLTSLTGESGDITLTCGDDSGCVIQEIYLTSDGTATLDLGAVTLNIAGEDLEVDDDAANMGTTGATALIRDNADTDQAILVLGAGDTVTIVVNAVAAATTVSTVTTVSSGVVSASEDFAT